MNVQCALGNPTGSVCGEGQREWQHVDALFRLCPAIFVGRACQDGIPSRCDMGQEGCTLIECATCVSVWDCFVPYDANLCFGKKNWRFLLLVGILVDMDSDVTFEHAALDACFALEHDIQFNASLWFRLFQSERIGGEIVVLNGRESPSTNGSVERRGWDDGRIALQPKSRVSEKDAQFGCALMGWCRDVQQGVARSQAHAMGSEVDVVSGFALAFHRASPASPGTLSATCILAILAPNFLAHLERRPYHGRNSASTRGEIGLLDSLSDTVP